MKKNLENIQKHLMTGISYMMPIIVIAGVTLGLTSLLGQTLFNINVGSKEIIKESTGLKYILCWLNQVAGKGMFSLMYPVLAGYIAFAIGDRPSLAPGMLGGYLAVNLNAGFIGAVMIGFCSGYIIKGLNSAIKIDRKYVGVKSLFILPVLGGIFTAIISYLVIGPIGSGFSVLSKTFVNSIGKGGGSLLSAILGAARAFDFGGPVNKMAGTIGKQLYFDTGYSYIALMLGALIPPIGIGISTIISKLFFREDVFDPQLQAGGLACLILGLLGISEGVLPFIIIDPMIIPICMVGAGVGGAIGFSLGAEVFPGSSYGFFMWPIVKNVGGFLIALLVGVAVVSILMIIHEKRLYNKKKKSMEVA
ncbi:fructose-specific PTS transporter subunit EIIC [Helcococcus ovis]|uniref:PTS fructose EIIBC subunit family protein n=1 Tax=Helcococcus ovis TaxID=72026 RepID=A0A4V3IYF4_9FIRM|nr:fructose-specific PTS transporter subunit EIIC [Helcococcus ovis]TFF66194.1 PTS fructose EIIBC subunit family protein [Helcococcus ovis]TFF67327.1 PTS fructose EIIBC subunit family protein [Helcococcus ovis]